MKRKDITKIQIIVQTILFFIPILFFLYFADYSISWDEHYVKTVNQRAFGTYSDDTGLGLSKAVIAQYDAEGEYESKVWKLEHKELYYYKAMICGIILGLLLQLGNVFWFDLKDEYFFNGY